MRRLLIISAEFTGHGHKSIADSIMERLTVYEDIEVMTIDGFDLMGKVQQICAEKTYGPITRLPSKAWATSYAAGAKLKQPVERAIAKVIRPRFEKLIHEFKPDCIMSVHPIFNGSVINLLRDMDLKIPFILHQADLIDIATYYIEPRADLTLSPSQEAYDSTVAGGVDPSRIRKVGFPVRSRFMGLADKAQERKRKELTITIMSGSEGSGVIRTVARELLHGTDAHVNVICGRNKALRKRLKKAFTKKYFGRVNVMGFVECIQDVMLESDILIMRASPNSVMEAVALNKPVILFGQLAGQELHNPQMLEKHGLAKYCPEPEKLPECVANLCRDGGAEIERMRACQRAYAPGDVCAETAKLLNDYIKPFGWNE